MYVLGVEVLWGIDLIVEEGDFYVFLGLNGVGKLMMIGIVILLVNKILGKVKIFGYDLDMEMVWVK